MKTLIAAAMLLAAASHPAIASSAAIWDCGKGVTATSSRGELGISFLYGPDRNSPDADDKTKYQFKGSRHFDLKWDLRVENKGPEVWLNGKLCKRTN